MTLPPYTVEERVCEQTLLFMLRSHGLALMKRAFENATTEYLVNIKADISSIKIEDK